MKFATEHHKRTVFLLSAIIILGVLLRCFNISAPLLGNASWRETQTAMITRNLVEDGFDVFHPRIDWFGHEKAYLALELPLYNVIVGAFYSLLGENEVFGRIVSILLSAATMFFFYRIALIVFEEKTALYALVAFILSPLSIYYGQTYMPEALMLFLSVGAIYFMMCWFEKGKKSHLFYASVFSMLAFLVKAPVTIQLCIPILYIFFKKCGYRTLKVPWFYFFFFVAYTPILIWTLYSQGITIPFFPEENIHKMIGGISIRLDIIPYIRILGFFIIYLLTPLGLIFFLAGFQARNLNPFEKIILSWASGIIIYIFIAFPAVADHHYYLVPAIPIVSLFIGKGIEVLASYLVKSSISKKALRYTWATCAGILILSLIIPLRHLAAQDTITLRAANSVKKHTANDDLVLTAIFHAKKNAFANPKLLYYANRHGWSDLFPYNISRLLKKIQTYRFAGASYIIITYSNNYAEHSILERFSSHRPDFDWLPIKKALDLHYTAIDEGEGYVLYSLSPP